MPHLEILAHIPNGRAEEVYPQLCDFESYSNNSKVVRSIHVNRLADGLVLSTWEVDFRGSIMSWTEKDSFDFDNHRICFEQTEGELEHYSGTWKVHSQEQFQAYIQPYAQKSKAYAQVYNQAQEPGCFIACSIDFNIGVPSLSIMLDPIATHVLKQNITDIILGVFGKQVKFLSAPAMALR